MRRDILLILVILFFSGCATKNLPPMTKYNIDESIKTKPLVKYVKQCKNIKIAFPDSSSEIYSKNIIYKKGLKKDSYYFNKWFSTPNDMLYRLFFSTIQSLKICKNIYLEDFDTPYEYLLKSNILEFSQKFLDKESFVEIKIVFYVKNKQGDLIAEKFFDETIKCKSNNAIGAVEAFNKASKKIAQKLVLWLTKILSIQSQQL